MASSDKKRPAPSDRDVQPPPVRLLLHTVNGIIPYLTPSLLEKYAPPSKHLWIGVAVRDSCVVPIFRGDVTNAADNKSESHNAKKRASLEPTKTCGYTFVPKDVCRMLQGHHRVVVPSFDLYQDVLDHSRRGEATVNSTNEHVLAWTTSGRHPLSSTLYRDIATDPSSSQQATVALYDMALDADSQKRKESASRRTVAWLNDLTEKTPLADMDIWAPVCLTGRPPADDERATQVIEHVCASFEKVRGIAIVGWHHISSREDRIARLQEIVEKTKSVNLQPNPVLAILSTRSTMQFLDAVRNGASIIGSALPHLWAITQKAFVCDLNGWKNDGTERTKLMNEAEPVDSDGCVDLCDDRWKQDSGPLVKGCMCLACRDCKHSRAYIHHLIKGKEILAEILLFVHNLQHLLALCRALSVDRELEIVCRHVESQLKEEKQE